jgi:hypothetical protein
MKKNITIIILSVCLALTVLVSVALCLYLPYKQTRWRELLWEDYLRWCDLIGCEANYTQEPEGVPFSYSSIRCMYSESFDLSIPRDPLPEGQSYGPSGTYVYDIFIHAGGTGSLVYQQWGNINTEIEEGHWISHSVLFAESVTALTAEEVESVLTVMEESRFQYVTAPDPYVTATDGNTTFIGYTGPIYTDFTDRDHGWSGHMISAFCAEEGDPCYEIRKAIEALVIAHNAGPVPVNAKSES